ncbi:MAG: type II toxin-antitoxin system RelE/ParE family toxin [Thermoanaerobaculia bacterium]
MDIAFRREKLRKVCNDARLMAKEYGRERAVKIQLRLGQFRAARTLADIAALPAARCHELQGERQGQLAVDLVHPWRLIFTPLERIEKETGGLDWSKVEAIVVEEIVDYH